VFKFSRYRILPLVVLMAFSALTGCGGGGGTGSSTTYTIGGTVTGLTGTGLILQDLGSDYLKISANGSFSFRTAIAATGIYSVSIASQPSDPLQTCTIANGAGTANSTVTNVLVKCVGDDSLDDV